MTLRILQPGMLTTVQDLGRPGHQREGIPVGGAMDALALRVANLLVGNDEDAAAVEITLVGPTIRFEEPMLIALAGADLDARIDERRVPLARAVRVPRGATLGFRGARAGCRVYVAVAGGIDVPPVLGSRGTYARAGLGGLDGRALRRGDVLARGAPSRTARRIFDSLGDSANGMRVAPWSVVSDLRPTLAEPAPVRLLAGAHASALTAASRRRLYDAEWRIAPQSDRMGYRLDGAALELAAPLELLSEPVVFGTVQLPPSGLPIVLMADRQTTGGYPRLGEVASVDLPVVAQLKPGDRLRFTPVSLEEAQRLYVARERELGLARQAIALRHT